MMIQIPPVPSPRVDWLLYLAAISSLLDVGPERSAGDTYEHEDSASRLQCVPEQVWDNGLGAGTPLLQVPVLPTLRSKLDRQICFRVFPFHPNERNIDTSCLRASRSHGDNFLVSRIRRHKWRRNSFCERPI